MFVQNWNTWNLSSWTLPVLAQLGHAGHTLWLHFGKPHSSSMYSLFTKFYIIHKQWELLCKLYECEISVIIHALPCILKLRIKVSQPQFLESTLLSTTAIWHNTSLPNRVVSTPPPFFLTATSRFIKSSGLWLFNPITFSCHIAARCHTVPLPYFCVLSWQWPFLSSFSPVSGRVPCPIPQYSFWFSPTPHVIPCHYTWLHL